MSNDASAPCDEPPDAAPRRCDVALQNPCRYPEAGAQQHRAWLEALLAELAPRSASFALRFVSDREMRRLNATFRSLDRSTDVLSFPDSIEDHLGDVAVSVPAARRQAAAAGHGVERELRILILHGVLHCLGWDHETDDGAMERFESRLRARWTRDG